MSGGGVVGWTRAGHVAHDGDYSAARSQVGGHIAQIRGKHGKETNAVLKD